MTPKTKSKKLKVIDCEKAQPQSQKNGSEHSEDPTNSYSFDSTSLRDRQLAYESRLEALEKSVNDIHQEVFNISKLLKGNGELGLFGQFYLIEERVSVLSRQWKWGLGLLVAIVIAALKTVIFGS